MKLSEAIREGCKYGPQLYFMLLNGLGASCAWGAATLGLGMSGWSVTINSLYSWAFAYKPIKCHSCACRRPNISEMIVHLNNDHRMSREAIAEFVEVEERKLGLWDEPAVEATEPIKTAPLLERGVIVPTKS